MVFKGKTVAEAIAEGLAYYSVTEETLLSAVLKEEEGLYEKYHSVGGDMIVTPKDIDMLTKRAARLVALSINCALQPTVSAQDMVTLTF